MGIINESQNTRTANRAKGVLACSVNKPDFCLKRKQSVVQWKGPDSERRLNPVWFGDKLKSTERKIKGKGEKRAWTASYFTRLLYDFNTTTSSQITQQQHARADS